MNHEASVLFLKRLATGYALLLVLAAGGLAFANLFGIAATAVQFGGETSPDTAPVTTCMHIGWFFGVGVALLAEIVQWRKRRAVANAGKGPTEKKVPPQTFAEPQQSSSTRRRGLLVSAAWGAFFGALLGTILGVTFILLWFSLTYSPFAPDDWVASVSIEMRRVSNTPREEPVATTKHPVAILAFALPVALGTLGGAIFGSIVRVTDDE